MVRCCGRFSSRSRRFQKLLRKSEASLNVELDIRKFIQRQHVAMSAVLGLLTGK